MNAVSARTIHIATFEHSGDNVVKAQELSVEDLIRLLTGEPELVTEGATKESGEAWSPVKYRTGTRSAAGVEALSAIAFDFDKGRDGQAGLTADDCNDLFDWLADTRWLFASHNSFTSGDYHPREKLRIVLFFDRDVTPEEYKRIWPALAAQMPVPPDPSCKNVDRIYFSPRIPAKHRAVYQADKGGTEFVEVDKILKKPTLGISLNNVKEPEFKSEEDLLKELETTKSKQETLNRVSFTLGKRLGEVGGTLNAAALDQGWAKCRAALERNKASEPVKDWAKAEAWCTRGMRQGHEAGSAERKDQGGIPEDFVPNEKQTKTATKILADAIKELREDATKLFERAYLVGRYVPHVLSQERAETALFNAAVMESKKGQQKTGFITASEATLKIQAGLSRGALNPAFVAKNENWAKHILKDENGIQSCEEAACAIFESHPELECVLRWNVRVGGPVLESAPPWPTHKKDFPQPLDEDDRYAAGAWVAKLMGNRPLKNATRVHRALKSAARAHEYDPFQEWLEALVWDGVPRLDTWLVRHAGVKDTRYTHVVSSKFVISAVARTYRPGCKVDYVLVLVGVKQGERKSTVFEALCGREYFCADVGSIDRPDASIALEKFVMVEMPEMANLDRKGVEEVKRWISNNAEFLRGAYKEDARAILRRAVIGASTNVAQFLRDETGNRRFWPCEVGELDIEGLVEERPQLWAEAVHRYKAGEAWWPNAEEDALCREVQEHHLDQDDLAEDLEYFYQPFRAGGLATGETVTPIDEQLDPESKLFRWVAVGQVYQLLGLSKTNSHDQLRVKKLARLMKWRKGSRGLKNGMKVKTFESEKFAHGDENAPTLVRSRNRQEPPFEGGGSQKSK